MSGQSSQVAPERKFKELYRGTNNSILDIADTGLERSNRANAQALANSTLSGSTPNGVLAGQVVAIDANGKADAAVYTGTTVADYPTKIVGLALNDARGYAFESTSGKASGKLPYVHGSQCVFVTAVYETVGHDGTTALTYAAGEKLYASANGLLTKSAGLPAAIKTAADAGDIAPVAIVLVPPVAGKPVLTAQLFI